uniref:SSD domain-containing protein n=2 Tax=Corethron hystrix TaxID=216773 RepID=A0A7S1B9P9_9STRA|mmetsp:Transcript_17807/g.40445  ORF Transcript_17807/g.40445 Transcript_17807/m.40445 type:complete len:938 (+) Transcript_17807:209-3022(+)
MAVSSVTPTQEKGDVESAIEDEKDYVRQDRPRKESTTDEEDVEKDNISESSKDASHIYSATFFTDNRGNLKFVTLVCARPFTMFFGILTLCLLFTGILVHVIIKEGNPFVAPSGDYDISDVRSTAIDSLRLAFDAVVEKRDEVEESSSEDSTDVVVSEASVGVRPQEEMMDQTWWIFESETEDGVFETRESIQVMKDAFDLYTGHEDYESYCQREYTDTNETWSNVTTTTSKCMTPLTPLSMYYASEWDDVTVQIVIDELEKDYPTNVLRYNFLGLCVEFDVACSSAMEDEDLEWATALHNNITRISDAWDGKGKLIANHKQATEFAAYMSELNTKRGLMDFGFDKNFNITNQKSKFSRGIVFWGGPLGNREVANYTEEREEEDEKKLKKYIVDSFLQDMNELSSENYNQDLNSYFFMGSLILEVLFDIVQTDALLALFSAAFVCIYIRISLGSWFLAAVGLLEIVLSIPVSWFIYSVCFQIKYFSFLNVLALFIVAAIGADDIFIFMDAYKQSATPGAEDAYILESLESRMSWVYRRTGTAMAITSATTCLAFLSTLATPLNDVRAFGIFASLVVFIDYVLVMTLFCTAVVIYHSKFETKACCKCKSITAGFCKTIEPSPTVMALENFKSNSDDGKSDKITKFFGETVTDLILNPKARLLIAFITTTWIITVSIFATKLKPTENAEQFLDENHPLQKSFSILGDEFNTAENDEGLDIFFAWGLGDVDRKGVNRLIDPEFFGNPTFLETFSCNEECQQLMVEACDDLRSNALYRPFIKQTDGRGTVKCFIEEFGAFSAIGSIPSRDVVARGAWKDTNWQVSAENFDSVMKNFLKERSAFSDQNEKMLTYYSRELGWDGAKLRYAAISVQSSVLDPYSSRPEPIVRQQYDAMVEISKDFDAKMEKTCGSKTIMTDLGEKFVRICGVFLTDLITMVLEY